MRIYSLFIAIFQRWRKCNWVELEIASRFRIYCVRIIIRLLPLRIKLQSCDSQNSDCRAATYDCKFVVWQIEYAIKHLMHRGGDNDARRYRKNYIGHSSVDHVSFGHRQWPVLHLNTLWGASIFRLKLHSQRRYETSISPRF